MTDSKNNEASQVHTEGTRQSTSTVGRQDADNEARAKLNDEQAKQLQQAAEAVKGGK